MLRTYVMLDIYRNELAKRLAAEDGQDLIEYALLVGLISIVAVFFITSAGQSVRSIFSAIVTELNKVPLAGS